MQTTFSSTRHSSSISINFIMLQGWHELSDKQLRYVYQPLANEFATDEVKTLCLLRWSGTKVIGRQENGSYLLQKGKTLFEVTPLTLAELLPHLDWLGSIPTVPVRISKINRQHALPAEFSEVPFESFIMADNLYKGCLATQDDSLLDELAGVLYGKIISLKPYERISVFYWMASFKDYFARRYSESFVRFATEAPYGDDFQPINTATGGNLLGAPSMNVEEAMNAHYTTSAHDHSPPPPLLAPHRHTQRNNIARGSVSLSVFEASSLKPVEFR